MLNEREPNMNNNLSTEVNASTVQQMIYTIRNAQVMLDFDLARIYGYEVRTLNQQVSRNITRFPDDFMFQLTKEEVEMVKSQIATSRGNNFFSGQTGGSRKLPYAFTEQGIYMLGTVLRGTIAEQQTIKVMRLFREMRQFIANNALMFEKISAVELKQLEYQKKSEEKFEQIFEYISEHKESNQKIFFAGQIFDAFSFLTDLIKKANKTIVLIDNYADIETLNILSKKKKGVSVDIFTLPNTKLTSQDTKKFNSQYPNIEIQYTKEFHDRFLIIDETLCYHIGASIKDAGQKAFAVNQIEDMETIRAILQNIKLNKLVSSKPEV